MMENIFNVGLFTLYVYDVRIDDKLCLQATISL